MKNCLPGELGVVVYRDEKCPYRVRCRVQNVSINEL